MPEWIDPVIEEPENFTVEINGKPLDLSSSDTWVRIPAGVLWVGKNGIVLKTPCKENSNPFGPLHDAVPSHVHNGPSFWLTNGDNFSDECILVESGLVEEPLAMV